MIKESRKKKKILLIYPPSPVMIREDRCQQPVKDFLVIPHLPPVDLMYMAAVAEQISALDSGDAVVFESKIVDYSIVPDSLEQFKLDIDEFQPDYLVANVTTPTLDSDLSVLRIAKENLPTIVTIVKGAHFISSNTEILDKHNYVDLILVGEVEDTLKEILMEKHRSEIRGLCYMDGLDAKYNGARDVINDLNRIPFPARHLVDNSLFRRPDNNKVQAIIKVSRGCPYYCFFCLATPVSGPKVRVRSPENIIEEIRDCVEKYNISNFLFWSDVFNHNRAWAMELCRQLVKSGLEITWSSNSRADTVDIEMAELMYESGCRLVSIGVESGSQNVLDKIGKRITKSDIRNAVKILKKAKIRVYNYYVIGLPWDDEDTVEETIQFAIELDSDFVSFHTATPLPGTRYYTYAHEQNLFDEKDSWQNVYYTPVVKTHFLTKERVFELHKEAIKRFYLRPMFILRSVMNIRTFIEFKNYFITGLNILTRK